jgi:hypothetical protein
MAVTVEVRGRKAGIDHLIDLRGALACYVGATDKAEAGAGDQGRQGIELTGFAPRKRRRGGERPTGRKVEVEAEREAVTRLRAG